MERLRVMMQQSGEASKGCLSPSHNIKQPAKANSTHRLPLEGTQSHASGPVCKMIFHKETLSNHLELHQSENTSLNWDANVLKLKCTMCSETACNVKNFMLHLNKRHEKDINIFMEKFASERKFMLWKKKIEEITSSHFVRNPGKSIAKSFSTHYFYCHRSGLELPFCIRKRPQESCKMGYMCTAYMAVKIMFGSGTVFVEYSLDHSGHSSEESTISDDLQRAVVEKLSHGFASAGISEEGGYGGASQESRDVMTQKDASSTWSRFNSPASHIHKEGKTGSTDMEDEWFEEWPTQNVRNSDHTYSMFIPTERCTESFTQRPVQQSDSQAPSKSCGHQQRQEPKTRKVVQVHEKSSNAFKCTECSETTNCLKNLIVHLSKVHHKESNIVNTKFPSESKFMEWKEEIEAKTSSRFTQHRSKRVRKTLSRTVFYCHRSGLRRQVSKNKRRTKSQGSSKLGHMCTAYIAASTRLNDGTVFVEYCLDHLGHSTDLVHLTLSDSLKKTVAEKLSRGLDYARILEEVKNEAGEGSRDAMVKRQDIRNVFCSLKFQQCAASKS